MWAERLKSVTRTSLDESTYLISTGSNEPMNSQAFKEGDIFIKSEQDYSAKTQIDNDTFIKY